MKPKRRIDIPLIRACMGAAAGVALLLVTQYYR